MLKESLIVISTICAVASLLSALVNWQFIPLETTSLSSKQIGSNYKVSVEYASWAFADNIWVALIVKGPANKVIDLPNLGPALKVTVMQNQTTLYDGVPRYALNFDENGETKVDIGFSYTQSSFEENVNFTVIAKIGTETAERRLCYFTFEDSFKISTLPAWIQRIVYIVSLIIVILDGIVFIVKRNKED